MMVLGVFNSCCPGTDTCHKALVFTQQFKLALNSWLWKIKQQLFSFKIKEQICGYGHTVSSGFNPPCVIRSDLC